MTQISGLQSLSTPMQSFALNQPASATEISQSFNDMLERAMNTITSSEQHVANLNQQFIQGDMSEPDNMLIASQKVLLNVELTVQIRNKAVEAYQEIMRMQI